MVKQKGAALIVVLSLLTVSLMVGLSSMQSSQIDERLAGNYKASAQAQMAAELGASAGLEVGTKVFLSDSDLSDPEDVWNIFASATDEYPLSYRYAFLEGSGLDKVINEKWLPDFAKPAGDRFVVGHGRVSDSYGNVDRYVVAGISDGLAPDLDAVFACFGLKCSHDAEDQLLGEDHPLPDDFNCNGRGCRTTPDPNRDTDSDVPKFVHFEPENSSYQKKREYWESFISSLPAPDASFSDGKIEFDGERNNPSVIEITGNVSVNRNQPTSGVIIVRAGGVLKKANGTAHHEGLILVEEGGKVNVATGTFNLYGGIVMLKSERESDYSDEEEADDSGNGNGNGNGNGGGSDSDLNGSGNSGLRYSSEAIKLMGNNLGAGDGKPVSWLDI